MVRPIRQVRRIRQAHRKQAHYRQAQGRRAHHKFSAATAHRVPTDLRNALTSAPVARKAWDDITPLARNEWVCWVMSVKKPETRSEHIKRAVEELKNGKRRPCCWAGCSHRSKYRSPAGQDRRVLTIVRLPARMYHSVRAGARRK